MLVNKNPLEKFDKLEATVIFLNAIINNAEFKPSLMATFGYNLEAFERKLLCAPAHLLPSC
jgi:hypothetical protein